ncbi:MAG: murein transglycosylase A [Microcystaceae cyanobacterium]
MKSAIATIVLGLGMLISSPTPLNPQTPLLTPVNSISQDNTLGLDQQLWNIGDQIGDRWTMIKAIDHSLKYLNTPSAIEAYDNYPISGITRDRVRRSLVRFRHLLKTSHTPQELQSAIQREFTLYQSVGNDKQGTVHFTGYFEPIYPASPVKTAEYPYPLYRKPRNFDQWEQPHPTRQALEGVNGQLGKESPLSGYELVWMRNRLDAYLVQVQGSAKLVLTNGKTMTVGYDGSTDYPYVSLGKELIDDGVFNKEELSLPLLLDYFKQNPQQLDQYIPRNNRFIFFRPTNGAPAKGSIGVPVTPERSIATDKSIMPPGALALLQTTLPYLNNGEMEMRQVSRYVLDQDTGSAIKGAGRVDVFMGTGKEAGDRAGLMNHEGQLYYLLLKN